MEFGTVLWGEAAAAVLPSPLRVEETFGCELPEGSLRLEEFRLSLASLRAESRGTVIAAEAEVRMLALFLSENGRQTLHRQETISRRVALSAFIRPRGAPFPPENWRAAASLLSYCPDCTRQRLTVRVSFLLTLCGTVRQLLPFPKASPKEETLSPEGAFPDAAALTAELSALRQSLSACREEILSLKYQLKANGKNHAKNQAARSPNPAPVHKLT